MPRLKLIVRLCLLITISLANDTSAVKTAHDLPSARIYKGFDSRPGQFPFQALLIIHAYHSSTICGGSLLSDRWVLTAAHCVSQVNSIEVHLGATQYSAGRSTEPGRIVTGVSRVIVHHMYNRNSVTDDVALLSTTDRIWFSETVRPVLLPTAFDARIAIGNAVVASGWGVMSASAGSLEAAQRLQYAQLRIISNDECARTYGYLSVLATTLCAKGEQAQSVCSGDSGGPLVLQGDMRTLVGVTSFGHTSGCHLDASQGFVRVTQFVNWIQQQTSNLRSF